MTKVRQTDQIYHKHISIGSSSPLKTLVQARRDDSPVSVITHSALISQPSSACTSMEHLIYQDVKLQSFQDHGYSTSDDDAFYTSGALSHECSKVGTLESLPETHSLSLNLSPKKLGCATDESRMRISFPKSQISESTNVDTDASGIDKHFAAKVNAVAPIDLLPTYNGGKGLQDKKVLTRSCIPGSPEHVILQCATTDRAVRNYSNNGSSQSKDQTTEGAFMPPSKEPQPEKGFQQRTKLLNMILLEKAEQQTKFTNGNSSNSVILEKLAEDVSKKRYGSQGAAMGMMRTCPSPGTPSLIPSRSSFSGVQNCAGYHFFGYNSIGGNGAGKGSRGLHDYIPGQVAKQGMALKALPSKWEDAEKWLNNVTDSPSHPKSRVSPATGSTATKSVHGGIVGKREANNAQTAAAAAATVTSGSEIAGGMTPTNRYQVVSSDSELPTATHEYRVLVRSASQKYRPGEKFARNSRAKVDAVSRNENFVKNMRINTPADSAACLLEDPEDSGGLFREDASPGSPFWKFGVDVGEQQGLSGGMQQQTDSSAEDKYADTVEETSNKIGFNLMQQDQFVVQTPCHGRSASMKDAATEISPTVSRRDMATQITPLSSSRTSRCTTPIKNGSPARHNTPTRRSASWSNAPGINLLELESCHLAKLELRDLPAGSQFQSFDKSVSNWSTREEEEEESSKCLRQVDIGDAKKTALEARAAAWEEAERMKYSAKYKREEANIEAWENHQKAKADAELKKLEVKLEKLRSHATEKIMNKLAVAHRRAEDMRAAAQAQQAEQIARTADRAAQIRKSGHVPAAPFGVCFARLS